MYTYRSGQRPLEGYTLKRGVGQGGFGEVYFALSDGGKEVALKLLKGHSEVELRGVANCLNMKHPNLVHVYDLKEDGQGEKWLIMEYVLGESLSAVLNRHPRGVPLNLIREWFAALCRAVAHLHDRGVVHRDLKPANIFLESGSLKVGDYGLCKSISVSQKQTRTVGTVHYMAPEVSTGNYSQRIDIYACGVILHELLTGQVPFDGESDGEILMKHLTATPDLDKVPEAFRAIVAKALDKNPVKRYASIGELAKAVEAVFEGLPTPAEVGQATALIAPIPKAMPFAKPMAKSVEPVVQRPAPVPEGYRGTEEKKPKLPLARALGWRDRWLGGLGSLLFAPLVAAVGLVPYALIAREADMAALGKMFLVTTSLAWAIILVSGKAEFKSTDRWPRRLIMGFAGVAIGILAFWMEGFAFPQTGRDPGFTTMVRHGLYFGGVLAAGRWWKATARDRKERFGFFPVIAAAFWSSALCFIWPWEVGSFLGGIVPVVLATIAVQLVSPWHPTMVVTPTKKLRLRGL